MMQLLPAYILSCFLAYCDSVAGDFETTVLSECLFGLSCSELMPGVQESLEKATSRVRTRFECSLGFANENNIHNGWEGGTSEGFISLGY